MKYFSTTNLRSGLSSVASHSMLLMLLLKSFSSLSLMSVSSKVSVLVFFPERISLVSFEHWRTEGTQKKPLLILFCGQRYS